MKYVRFKADSEVKYGILNGEQIQVLDRDRHYPLSEVDLLAPCQPNKIVCVGLNYLDHARELDMELPEEPVIFIKPATAVIGPEDVIKYPAVSSQVDYEAEIAAVIKREAKDITAQEAEDYTLGYTCFNDITARDLQDKDGQWTRAKSFDTFAPLGPVISTEVDPNDLQIQLFQNGSLKQESTTGQMIFKMEELISFISQIMTLKPGDVVATGTPPGVGSVQKGDQLEVRIEGIGGLINHVG
ncbi:fumarylacetoacetate hydrolase family protein [Acetohalobium arabaticum]|uniref:5-carboxymethyl-2-hydroxymuconateDelta-isomerase n=1 Tax=Acetohalobium arabaticum (strain ATCC 49924 / DSM 5501 / Z-7288) TaxID=574087 RepID=D9QT97_ACEAZ|nr:fumarylacetoacetate hydrolase family protein [Acetohalobium arabaticum]ADL13597.1 5-carboxymethyl-2-hydroxymuconateDelta-isomerase [Acetohalobium arabaticum DSM 5501]